LAEAPVTDLAAAWYHRLEWKGMVAGHGLEAVSRPKLHCKDLDICCRLLRRCAVSLPLAVFNVALVGQFDQASVVQEAENRLKEESILKGDGDCLL
jgi:hypothetical protein